MGQINRLLDGFGESAEALEVFKVKTVVLVKKWSAPAVPKCFH